MSSAPEAWSSPRASTSSSPPPQLTPRRGPPRPGPLRLGAVRRSLVEPARGLHAHGGLVEEGLAARGAGVRERRLQPGQDLDEDVAHALAPLLQVHLRRRYTLAEEALLCPL